VFKTIEKSSATFKHCLEDAENNINGNLILCTVKTKSTKPINY